MSELKFVAIGIVVAIIVMFIYQKATYVEPLPPITIVVPPSNAPTTAPLYEPKTTSSASSDLTPSYLSTYSTGNDI